jgi:TRAP-type transport system small permease protein
MYEGQIPSQADSGPKGQSQKAKVTAEYFITLACRYLNILGVTVLLGMTALTVCDVIGRIFKHPIVGSTEITEFLMVTVTFLCVSWAAIKGRMITVDLITTRLPKKVNSWLNSVTLFVGFWFMAVLTWQSYLAALSTQEDGVFSIILHIPSSPFMWILTVGFGVLSIVIGMQFVQNLVKAVSK